MEGFFFFLGCTMVQYKGNKTVKGVHNLVFITSKLSQTDCVKFLLGNKTIGDADCLCVRGVSSVWLSLTPFSLAILSFFPLDVSFFAVYTAMKRKISPQIPPGEKQEYTLSHIKVII